MNGVKKKKKEGSTYVGTVNVFQTSADLIDKILKVSICQGLTGSNDLMKIGFHQLLDEITRECLNKERNAWVDHLHFIKVLKVDNVHIKHRSNLKKKTSVHAQPQPIVLRSHGH